MKVITVTNRIGVTQLDLRRTTDAMLPADVLQRLSIRSLAMDTLQDIVIFLYLYDYEDTSRIVLSQLDVSALIGARLASRRSLP